MILYLFARGYKSRLAAFPTRFAHVISILRYCHCFASLKVLCHEQMNKYHINIIGLSFCPVAWPATRKQCVCVSGVNGSVTLGDGLTQRGRYPGGRKPPSGSRGEYPIRGLVDEPPQEILIFIFYGWKIENAYMSRCFLKRTHAAVLWIHDNRHTYDSYVCLLCPINHPYLGGW